MVPIEAEVEAGTGYEDFFETPTIEVPKTPPDAHQATITGVTLRRLNNDKETAVIAVGLVSKNIPTLEASWDIFVPKVWEENISDPNFTTAQLPEEEGNKQQTSYRMGIANSEKTAAMQRLYVIAREAGRDPRELGLNPRPATLEEYVENYNKLLTGLDVIFKRRERGGDDAAFKHQLQVRDVVGPDDYEKSPKSYKKYALAWEQ